jgi:hypothetical protein
MVMEHGGNDGDGAMHGDDSGNKAKFTGKASSDARRRGVVVVVMKRGDGNEDIREWLW